MKAEKKSFLIALALGDGYIRLNPKAKKRRTGQFSLLHSIEQLAYLEWKRDKLSSYLGGKKPIIRTKKVLNKQVNKVYERAEFNKTHKYFAIIHKWLYPNGVKTISRKILNHLTPEGIAIWFMDDGHLKIHRATTDRFNSKPKGKISSIQVYLATHVTYDNAIVIQEYFKEVWDIGMKISKVKSSGNYFHYMNTKEGKKFLDLISKYIIPSMLYKILPSQERPVFIQRERIKRENRERYSLNCLETYRSS